MGFNLTRMKTYALIGAIEEDLRHLIAAHIQDESKISKVLLDRAKDRIKKDVGVIFGDLELRELIDYFDIGDTFQTINSNKDLFPDHIYKTVKTVTKDLEGIVSIRNRVMHMRPLNFSDLPIVSEFCNRVIELDKSIAWGNISGTIERLNEDPSFVLSLEINNYDYDDESIGHNLPFPDFDETGLIGRDKEIEHLTKLCLGAFPVISILGEGGVGKSALALKVAYELINKSHGFDAVIWVTLNLP